MRENYIVWEWEAGVLKRTPWGSNFQAAWDDLITGYEVGRKPWMEWRRIKQGEVGR